MCIVGQFVSICVRRLEHNTFGLFWLSSESGIVSCITLYSLYFLRLVDIFLSLKKWTLSRYIVWTYCDCGENNNFHLSLDGNDALCAGIELGFRAGYQKRNKDITNWVKKKRRNIRREDILSNLSGRSPPRRRVNDKGNSISLSPKPMSPTNDHISFPDTREFDFNAFVEGRNPYGSENRKRLGELNSMDSPHKRGKFC